ncbi:nuclear apoptosis-inducing factor 1 [Protopterus annectens]|uniref:nuclear apoptosis-inducing factor 1 n=1 Tax=Protopterus annectens TaxID=7888 RepID=UPI001CFB9EE0|nr:nuclear apoptosis-inducing factor 1 [Protopterus annectens]
MANPAKKRKMNFSEREVEIIIEELEKQKHVLINHFNAGVPLLTKNNAWQEVLKRVNAITTCHREMAEVKKKWSDLKTEVRRKVAQVRAAMESESDVTTAPVVLTAMQQRICNLLGEATIVNLPSGESTAEIPVQVPVSSATSVTVTQKSQDTATFIDVKGEVITAATAVQSTSSNTTPDVSKTVEVSSEPAIEALEGVVEYCTTEAPTAVTGEAPVEAVTGQTECSIKPQELKSRIALNSARLLQEQRVTNLHVKEIAQHLEHQNDLLQMIRRSQEAQACAQERQAQALEGTQAALCALIQILRPVVKDLRKFLQSSTNTQNPTNSGENEQVATQPEEKDNA